MWLLRDKRWMPQNVTCVILRHPGAKAIVGLGTGTTPWDRQSTYVQSVPGLLAKPGSASLAVGQTAGNPRP